MAKYILIILMLVTVAVPASAGTWIAWEMKPTKVLGVTFKDIKPVWEFPTVDRCKEFERINDSPNGWNPGILYTCLPSTVSYRDAKEILTK